MLPAKMPSRTSSLVSYPGQRGSRHEQHVALDTRFLIVDGDRPVGLSLSFMLEARGYGEVRAVRSAARAEAIFGVFQPDIVFLDLDPPDSGNMQLPERLRRISRLRNFRLIALTRNVEHPLRDQARDAGFERYLVKPVAQDELDKVLFIPATTS